MRTIRTEPTDIISKINDDDFIVVARQYIRLNEISFVESLYSNLQSYPEILEKLLPIFEERNIPSA